jgi:hypothetical protein
MRAMLAERTVQVATTRSRTKQDADKRIAEHKAAIALYLSTVGAQRAKHSRTINRLELAMVQDGLAMSVPGDDGNVTVVVDKTGVVDRESGDFTMFVPPSTVVRKELRTEAEVLSDIESDRAIYANEAMPDRLRSNAEKELRERIAEARRRGLDIPQGYEPPTES